MGRPEVTHAAAQSQSGLSAPPHSSAKLDELALSARVNVPRKGLSGLCILHSRIRLADESVCLGPEKRVRGNRSVQKLLGVGLVAAALYRKLM